MPRACGVVDAYDLVPELPGFLTTDPPIEVEAVPTPQARGTEVPAPSSAVDDSAPVPTKIPEKIDAILKESCDPDRAYRHFVRYFFVEECDECIVSED